MTRRIWNLTNPWLLALAVIAAIGILADRPARAETRTVGAVTYNWKTFGKNDEIVVTVVNDPKVDGVLCYWSAARIGGIKGAIGIADDPPEASLACRQVGPIAFKAKFDREENIAKTSQNWTGFKTMQVVRMCDPVANVLTYVVYTDELIKGFPKNSLSVVPVFSMDGKAPPQCKDWMK